MAGPDLASTISVLQQCEPDFRTRGILHAGIIGSVARGDARPDSDIDIVIEVQSGMAFGTTALIEVEEQLTRMLGRPVEVHSSGGLRLPKHQAILSELVRAF